MGEVGGLKERRRKVSGERDGKEETKEGKEGTKKERKQFLLEFFGSGARREKASCAKAKEGDTRRRRGKEETKEGKDGVSGRWRN